MTKCGDALALKSARSGKTAGGSFMAVQVFQRAVMCRPGLVRRSALVGVPGEAASKASGKRAALREGAGSADLMPDSPSRQVSANQSFPDANRPAFHRSEAVMGEIRQPLPSRSCHCMESKEHIDITWVFALKDLTGALQGERREHAFTRGNQHGSEKKQSRIP